jgi:hypothetical protein
MAVVLLVTFSTPARAEAEVLTVLAIASLVVVGVIVIAYLVIASTKGDRAGTPQIVWVAAEPATDPAAP